MATKEKIYQKCQNCRGDKIIQGDWDPETQSFPLVECPECDGKGSTEWGYVKISEE